MKKKKKVSTGKPLIVAVDPSKEARDSLWQVKRSGEYRILWYEGNNQKTVDSIIHSDASIVYLDYPNEVLSNLVEPLVYKIRNAERELRVRKRKELGLLYIENLGTDTQFFNKFDGERLKEYFKFYTSVNHLILGNPTPLKLRRLFSDALEGKVLVDRYAEGTANECEIILNKYYRKK